MTEIHEQPTVPGETLFFDDFCAESLDRAQWNVEITGEIVNHEQQAYIDSPDTIYTVPPSGVPADTDEDAHGVLVLHPRWRPGFRTSDGQQFDFVSGRINTRGKAEFTYGNISARIKMPVGIGVWPAFWAMGAGEWPECGEIDVMEYVGEPDWVSAAVHGPGYSGDGALVNNYYFPSDRDASAWHIYAVEWTCQNGLLFKIDDELIYRVTRPMVENFGRWTFSAPKYLVLNFALGGKYPFKINGVNQPYFGLPNDTAEAIHRDQVRLMVDWVKVSRLPE